MRSNPFPVQAWFDVSLTVTFVVPVGLVRGLLPGCLEPDVFDGRWGFAAVAAVRTRNLRPKGLPEWMGRDFLLLGYRVFVRYRSRDGRTLRGLYILRSETDRSSMVWLGNLFTPYRYELSACRLRDEASELQADNGAGGLRLAAREIPNATLPEVSPLGDWDTARRFSGPLPFTFSYDEARSSVTVIEGRRSGWTPRPVQLVEAKVPCFDSLGLGPLVPSHAFVVRGIPYEWRKGRREPWLPSPE
jgi:hypothetical protein